MPQPAHQGALRLLAAHRDDALSDVFGQVSDSLQVVGDAQHRHQRAQIDGHGLPQRDRRHGLLLDLPLQLVDCLVGRDDLARQGGVAPRKRLDGVGDLLLREAAHPRDHLRELDQVAVEDFRGMVGDIHGGAADVDAPIRARRCHNVIRPADKRVQRLDEVYDSSVTIR